MPRRPVVTRARVPRDFKPRAEATLDGTLKWQPELRSLRGDDFCEAVIVVIDSRFRVQCEGDAARRMATKKAGEAVRVSGRLTRHVWENGAREKQERMVLLAKHVHSVRPPKQKDVA